MSAMRKLSPAAARWMLIVAVLILWEAYCRFTDASPILIAPPSKVLWAMLHIGFTGGSIPDFFQNAWVTIEEVLIAYAITAVLGIAIGMAFSSSKLVGDAFEPVLLILYAIPKIILYPVIILILGIGILPNIVFGILLGIFVVVFNTTAGLRQIEPNYISLARSLGYGRLKIFFKVVLPAAAPTILTGLRLGFGYTVIGVIAGELLVVNSGLGFLIDWASVNYHTPQLYALILITLCIGVAGNIVFSILERRWVR
jgi:NitT/TauT family transport system permease protein